MKYYRSSAISFVRPRLIRAPFSHRIQHFFMFLCIVWFHPTLIVSSVPQTSDPLFASSRTVASLTILQINQTEPIQSLLYNDRNSSLYVGTVNAIHLLKDDTWIRPNDRFVKQVSFPKSDSFNLSTWVEPVRYVSTFSTNLIDDDDRCAPWPVSCRYNRSRPINHNRLLLHVPHSKYTLLIACGTAYQGMCYILSESNGQLSGDLLGDPTLVSNYVASSRSSLAVQVFVNRIPTYFIAHAPDGRPADYRPPTFSARRMNNTKTAVNLVYRYDKQSLRTTLRFRSDLAAEQKFPVEYVYGFSHGKYVYIVKNQPLVEGDPKSQMWETRLGRVCVEDDRFFSYSEIPMSCNVSSASVSASASSASGPMELVYERSMAADLAEADPALIQRLSLHTDNRALFIAFGSLQSVSHSRTGLASGSVVCAFGMESIVERFEKAINACLDGDHVVTGLMSQYESVGAKRCQRSSSSDSDYQCHGSNLNHYIESHLSLHGVPLVSLPQHVVSSLKVTLQGKDSAFQAFMIGSDDGVVIKASRQVGGQIRLASQLKVSNRPIVANSPWDRSRQFLFVAAGSDVFKYPLTSCSLYADSCSSCVTASEPLGCGWLSAGPLGSIGTCVSRADYEQIKTKITEPHLLSHEHCSPRLLAIYPTSGPTAGGTQLRLTGHHLAAANAVRENPNYLVNVTVGGRSCTVQPTEGSNLTCQVPPADPNTWSAQVRVCVQDFTRLQHKLFDVDGCSELGTFSYVSATVEKVSPNFGPVSGGTIVHLTGKHLDSGSSRSVHINEIVCEILSYNQTMLACRTGRLKPRNKSSKNTTTDETNLPEFASSEDKLKQFNQNSSILLTIDGFTTKFDSASLRFEYRPDPNVRDFRPRAAIPGIGMYFTFTGRHLDSVLHPQLSLRVLGQQRRELQLNTPCLVLASSERPSTAINVLLNRTNSMNVTNTWNNGRWMADQDNTNEVISDDSLKSTAALKSGKDQRLVCLVPALPADWAISSAHAPLIAYLNLTLDGSQALSRHLTNAHILLYPLPDLRPPVLPVVARSATATGGRRTNRLIRIEGNNLSTEYPIRIQLTSGDQRVFCNRWQSTSSRLIECEMSPASIGLADEWKVDMLIGRLALPYGSVRFGESNIAHRGWLFWIGWLFIVLIIAGSAVFCLLVRPQILLPKFSWIGKAAQSKKEAAVSYNPVGNPNHSLNPHDSWFGPSSVNGGSMIINTIPDSITELLAREDILIPRSCLEIGDKLGTGYFGCVFKGVLKLPTQQEPLDVAVKTLKNSNESPQAVNEFLDEALRMKDFRNDHVLTLVGVCVQPDTTPMLVLPYMANGDLLSYIRNPEHRPTVRKLLCYGIDVALGMDYLSSLKYVHRDLAARNVMLDDRLRAKVADFGLTRDVYERNYYLSNRITEVPIKWMAPECIEKGVATSHGDVWSYGVLLWELMTRGNQPYALLGNHQVLDTVKRGERMPRPDTCPLEVYELMLDCWNLRPELRPPFKQIADRLNMIIAEKQKAAEPNEVEMQPDLLVTYANYPVQQYYNSGSIQRETKGSVSSMSTFGRSSTGQPIVISDLNAISYANLSEQELRKPMLNQSPNYQLSYESEL